MLKKQKPMSYTTDDLVGTLDVNNPINSDYLSDYLCENPWSVKGIEAVPGIEVDKGSLSEIIREAIREAIQEKNLLASPEIEKYHIKHR